MFKRVFSIRWMASARAVFLPDRPNGIPSYPAPRCPVAPPCAASNRPARCVSGFWIRHVFLQKHKKTKFHVNRPVESKTGHTTGGSGRSARWSGRAGSGKIGFQQNYSPRKHKSTVPPKHRGNVVSTFPQKHELAKSYVNRRRNKTSG